MTAKSVLMRPQGRSPQPPEARGSGGRVWQGGLIKCGAPIAWRFLEIYYQNNPFLGMFQMKFCL